MKTIISIFILTLVLSSCNKEEPKAVVLDCGVGITILDKSGNDLLNPSYPGAYLQENIKIFYLTNRVKQEVYYANYTFPRNFFIDQEAESDGNFWMTLFLNASPTEEYSITYIQWNENDTDTLKTQIYKGEGIVVSKDLWFNDSLIWKYEDYDKGARNIHIIK